MRPRGFGFFHQCRNRAPGITGFFGIDAVEAEHHRRVQHAAGIIADLERCAGPGREIAVAGAIDVDAGTHRLPSRLGLHHQRVDAPDVMHHHAGAERMKEDVHLVRGEQVVGRDLVGRGVIGLREDLSENEMRRVQPAEPVDSIKQFGGNALHHPMHLAMDIGMQPAEIRHARGRAHAAEETIAFDQQGAAARARSGDGGGDAGRSAAQHRDVIFAIERNLACRFGDGFGRQNQVPGSGVRIMPLAGDFGYLSNS
jgi:hypothetical protein